MQTEGVWEQSWWGWEMCRPRERERERQRASHYRKRMWDNCVSAATRLQAAYPTKHRSKYDSAKSCVSSPKCPNLLWGPFSVLFNGYRKHFLRSWKPCGEADHWFDLVANLKVSETQHPFSLMPLWNWPLVWSIGEFKSQWNSASILPHAFMKLTTGFI